MPDQPTESRAGLTFIPHGPRILLNPNPDRWSSSGRRVGLGIHPAPLLAFRLSVPSFLGCLSSEYHQTEHRQHGEIGE